MKAKWFYLVTGVLILVFGLSTIIYYKFLENSRKEYIRIGAILPLTGDVASYGKAAQQGIELAAENINLNGGINKRKIKIYYQDDKAQPQDGVNAFINLVQIDKVIAVIGAVPSSVTLAIAPVAEKDKIPLLSPASSSPLITNAGDYIFRNYPSDELEGVQVADYALSLQYKTAVTLTINNDYGKGLMTVFKKEYSISGGKIINSFNYTEGETNFQTILFRIKELKPQCVFIVGYGKELGKIVKQARELDIKVQFFSTVNFLDQQTIETGGTSVEGVIFSSPVFDPSSGKQNVKQFVNKFNLKYHKDPDVWSAHAYDALNLLAYAIKNKGVSPNGIKNGLYEIKNFDGVSGITTFDNNGDVIKEVRFMTVKDGKFINYK